MPETTEPQLTEAQVAEIEARANTATKGDWTIRGGSWIDGGVRLAGYGVRFADAPFDERYEGWDARTNFPPETPEGAQASADRSFLAHARTDIPALIRDWRAMRDENQRYAKVLSDRMRGIDTLEASFDKLETENAALREQLAQAESDRDYWKERVFRVNKGLQP